VTRATSLQKRTVRLGEIAEFRNGVNFAAADRGPGIPVLNVKDFKNRTQPDYSGLEELKPKAVRDEALIRKGDTLFVRSNGNKELIGRSMHVRVEPSRPTTHSAFTIRMRVTSAGADPLYCAYYVRGGVVRRTLTAHGSGTNISNLSQDVLERLEIWLPPLEDQHHISSVLAAYDDLIDVNVRRIAILEEIIFRVFGDMFGDGVDEWPTGTIGELSQYINRGLAPRYDENASHLIINQKCIRNGHLSLDHARHQSRSVPMEKLVQRFDVLVNSTGVGTLGRVAQAFSIPSGTAVDTHVTIVRPKSTVDPHFFGVQLLSCQNAFEGAAVGSTGQTELSRASISELPIIIPPKALCDAFGRLVGPLRTQAEVLSAQIANLSETRDLLLPKLISGETNLERATRRMERAAEQAVA
jgi:type I restriction enzyme S subunit